MPRRVQGPDGTVHEFPSDATDDEVRKALQPESVFDRMKRVHDTAEQNIFGSASKSSTDRYNKAQASATQDIKNAYGRAAGETAAMVPFAIAAPFTEGASLPAGVAIMGTAGLASGLAREGTKKAIGSSEVPKGKDLAFALGADALFGIAAEGTGRALMLGKTLLPKILQRASARSELGKRALLDDFTNTRNALYESINKAAIPGAAPEAVARMGETQSGSVFVDVERPMREAYEKIAKLPKAKGAFLGGETKLTPEAGEIIREIEKDLHLQVGIGQMQPLDGLVRAKGNFQQRVYNSRTLNDEERKIFYKLAEDLHDVIRTETKSLGPETAALYKKVNDLGITLNKATVANTIAERFINTYAGRAAMGVAIGGSEGYRRGGAGGAAIGAAAGAGASVAVPGLAAVILQQTIKHPEAAKILSRALDLAINGKDGLAKDVAARAFAVAGVRETIKEAIKQQPEQP